MSALTTKALTVTRLEEQLSKEIKIKAGFEKLLMALPAEAINRKDIEAQLISTTQRIQSLEQQLSDVRRSLQDARLDDQSSTNSGTASPEVRRKVFGSTNESGTHLPLTKNHMRVLALKGKEYLENLANPEADMNVRKICIDGLLSILKMKYDHLLPTDQLVKIIRACIADPNREVRTQGFRLTKYFCHNKKNLRLIIQYHFEIFLSRTIIKDHRSDSQERVEREQALRVLRCFVETPGGAELIPPLLIRSIVAVAEQPDDRFRTLCLETLCELVILNTEAVILANGVKVIMMALIENGPKEMFDSLLFTLLYLLDSESTRAYFRKSVELEFLLSSLTDAYSKGSDEKVMICAKATLALLRTWTGVIYLCQDDKRAIRSIVDALRLANDEVKKIVLQLLFDVFRIELPKWYPDFVSARGTNVNLYSFNDDRFEPKRSEPPFKHDRLNLVDHYQAMVLIAFIESGLLESLIQVVQNSSTNPNASSPTKPSTTTGTISSTNAATLGASGSKYISIRATILIGEVLELVNRLLPMSYGIKSQSLPSLFKIASNFKDESSRHHATLALIHIDNLHKTKEKLLPQLADESEASRRWITQSLGKTKWQNLRSLRTQRQVEQVKMKMGFQIDDRHFLSLLQDSHVSEGKDYTKWDWDAISELMDGPLYNPKRLEDALNPKHKFVKRLLSFFRPLNYQFSTIKKNKGSSKYVRAGSELLKVLIKSPEGIKFLSENKFLKQIADCLQELDADVDESEAYTTKVFFSATQMQATLTSEYFAFLGTLSRYEEGVKLFEKFRIFDLIYRLTERLREEDKIGALCGEAIRLVIRNFDYSTRGHARIVLSKVLTSAPLGLRLFATKHLREIFRSSAGLGGFADWGIALLVTQLYDPHPDIREQAIRVLDEAVLDQKCLQALVDLRPVLDHLPDISCVVYLRLLSTSDGFEYLMQRGWVRKEMEEWFEFGNVQYVTKLEICLAHVLSPVQLKEDSSSKLMMKLPGSDQKGDAAGDKDNWEDMELLSYAPTHFYGQLTRTDGGCDLLRETGHFMKFIQIIHLYGLGTKSLDATALLKLKAALWAVGNIGSTKKGLPFLLETQVVQDIALMAELSTTLSLKGTCYFVLGLISKTPQGVEVLESLGWEAVSPPYGQLEGLCVPKESSKFLSIPEWQFRGSWADQQLHIRIDAQQCDFDATEIEILKAVANMSNHIVANAASKSLNKIRHEKPDYFTTNIRLYLTILRLQSLYTFKLVARRYVQDLFDRLPLWQPELLRALDHLNGVKLDMGWISGGGDMDAIEKVLEGNMVWNGVFAIDDRGNRAKKEKEAQRERESNGNSNSKSSSATNSANASVGNARHKKEHSSHEHKQQQQQPLPQQQSNRLTVPVAEKKAIKHVTTSMRELRATGGDKENDKSNGSTGMGPRRGTVEVAAAVTTTVAAQQALAMGVPKKVLLKPMKKQKGFQPDS